MKPTCQGSGGVPARGELSQIIFFIYMSKNFGGIYDLKLRCIWVKPALARNPSKKECPRWIGGTNMKPTCREFGGIPA